MILTFDKYSGKTAFAHNERGGLIPRTGETIQLFLLKYEIQS